MNYDKDCPKMKMNGKKLRQFQFYFPGLLGTSLMLEQETKKSLINSSFRYLQCTQTTYLPEYNIWLVTPLIDFSAPFSNSILFAILNM